MPVRRFVFLLQALLISSGSVAQQTPGCTDRAAHNYNATATSNNGSCTYLPLTITPSLKFLHTDTLKENSGMVYWNGFLWHHIDNGSEFPSTLFATDTSSNFTRRTVILGTSTKYVAQADWEDIAQDDTHIYIGDFGNNVNGARTDLRIYKISKSDLTSAGRTFVEPAQITFRYPDQALNPSPVAVNTSDFDCEAMVAYNGKLYLFTKQWTSGQTALYELPNTAGNFTATKLGTLNVNGLITGADIIPERRVIVLTGYTITQERFLYLLYDFTGNAFFGGNKRRIGLQGFAQTEAVAFVHNNRIFIGSERLTNLPAMVEAVDLSALLKDYYALVPLSNPKLESEEIKVYYQHGWLHVSRKTGQTLMAAIYSSDGRLCRRVALNASMIALPMSGLPAGTYFFRAVGQGFTKAIRFVVGGSEN